ncbi:MAG: cytochrome b/b6 domain-containing protein [Pseudomonadota bacterium]
MAEPEDDGKVWDFKVWDISIRLFHWSLAILIFLLWQTGENGSIETHRQLGLAVLGLLVYRIYWGFFGPKTARFSDFPIRPGQILRYIPKLFKQPYEARIGHNPLASLSIIAILGTLCFQVGTGLFATDTDGLYSGYFGHLVSFDMGRQLAELHEMSFNVISALVILHLCAIAYYALALATDLVTAMVTGTRDVDAETAATTPQATTTLPRLAVGAVLAGVSVWAVLYFGS